MIRFRLAELLAEKGFREGRRVEIGEVADATGIHRSTLSRILNVRGANLTAANMDRLCRFFGCALSDLAEYVPDDVVEPVPAARGAAKSTGSVARHGAKTSRAKSR